VKKKITLAAARVNAGLTQEEMGKKIGVDRRVIISWENGSAKMRPGYVIAWAAITGFDVEDFSLPEKSTL
jgi:DNA-binding XRE family transcriptional regulator